MRRLALIFFLCFSNLQAANTIQDRTTNISFPTEVSFDNAGENYSLEVTGVAVRKKFFVKVYAVAHYMEKPEKGSRKTVINDVLNDHRAKQLTIHWLRSVSGDKIRDGYLDALSSILGRSNSSKMAKISESLTDYFSDGAKKNDQHILRWMPDGTLIVEINGEVVGTIEDDTFAKAVWEIWFGPRSVVNRNQLIEHLVSPR